MGITIKDRGFEILRKVKFSANITDEECEFFIRKCESMNLDPCSEMAYLSKRIDNKGNVNLMFILSINAFRLIADRTGRYCGMRNIQFSYNGVWKDCPMIDKKPEFVRASFYKLVNNKEIESSAIICASEYDQSNAKDWNIWKSKYYVMLLIKLEAVGLRTLFPIFANAYTEEEINDKNFEDSNKEDSNDNIVEDENEYILKVIAEKKKKLSEMMLLTDERGDLIFSQRQIDSWAEKQNEKYSIAKLDELIGFANSHIEKVINKRNFDIEAAKIYDLVNNNQSSFSHYDCVEKISSMKYDIDALEKFYYEVLDDIANQENE